jgi:hypothetical protein
MINLFSLENDRHFRSETLVLLRESLQSVLDQKIGYERFAAYLDPRSQRTEILFTRRGQLAWFVLGRPNDGDLLQFARDLSWMCRLDPQLADFSPLQEASARCTA